MKHSLLTILFLLIAASNLQAQVPHPERIYLSGTGIDDTRTWEFRCSKGNNSGRWMPIEVPCCWELQGFGDYTYGRWYTVKGQKPSDETGTYRHRFDAPKSWQGQRVKLVFDGVMTDADVLINGKPAGETHRGAFYRFSYDITDLLHFGQQNVLEVHVAKQSANKSVNAAERRADWWLFGGIYRPVWLEVVPQVHMARLTVDADQTGRLRAKIDLEGKPTGYRVEVSLHKLDDGQSMTDEAGQTILSTPATGTSVSVDSRWPSVERWTPETPHLYIACFNLKSPEGQTLQTKELRVGFRTVEFFPQDGLYLNGTKLVLKGINRHSFSVDGGRTTSAGMSREDALLLKAMNMNAVRSHYPPDEHFLDMCDSLGLVYIDELAGWHGAYDTPTGTKLVKEMVERDVNHPCIVLWSNGNEGGWNTRIDPLFAEYDTFQKRHVIHPWADFNDLDTHHYPAYLTGVARFTNGYKVFMPTEFMHAMYDQGGGAGLRDFWDRWCTNPLFAGAFVWAFCDEAPKRTDRGGVLDSDKSNAPDGVLGPRREKEGSFYAIRAQWSPLQIKPLSINSHFDGSFLVTNEYLFTNLSDCSMTWKLLGCDTPMMCPVPQSTIIDEGQVELPAIRPGETGTARFTLPETFRQGDILQLEAFDKEGKSICEWSYPIRPAKRYYEDKLAATPATLERRTPAHVTRTSDAVTLESEHVTVSFDATTGCIRSIRTDGTDIPFGKGPVPVGMKMRYDTLQSYVRQDGNTAVYCAKYKGGADSIVWRLTDDGLLHMDALLLNRTSGGGGFDDAFMDTEVYNLGLTFSYPEQACSGMRWLGRGPYRVWKNRVPGTNYNIWQKDYNNTITGESFESLVYPEFKGYHANLYWATMESDTTPFTVYARTDGIYYRVFTPEEPSGSDGHTMPAFPEGDLSFLLDIPAIRSFKPIEQQGPNSQPGNIRIKKGDEGLHIDLTFDFRRPQ